MCRFFPKIIEHTLNTNRNVQAILNARYKKIRLTAHGDISSCAVSFGPSGNVCEFDVFTHKIICTYFVNNDTREDFQSTFAHSYLPFQRSLKDFDMKNDKQIIVVVADDDEDDRLMTKEAFEESGLPNKVLFVKDGIDLMDYLHRNGQYADPEISPRPGLILLDLNMPRMDGREALKILKSDDELKSIPVTIFTTSKAQEDVVNTYGLGSNCFITKPVTYSELVNTIRQLGTFWFDLVEIPIPKP